MTVTLPAYTQLLKDRLGKIDPDIKVKWIAALRSGEFKQCYGELVDDDGNCCAMGVLGKILNVDVAEFPGDGYVKLAKTTNIVKCNVAELTTIIVELNDHQLMTFNEIADYIEANL